MLSKIFKICKGKEMLSKSGLTLAFELLKRCNDII